MLVETQMGCGCGNGRRRARKWHKNEQKTAPKKWARGPGRGVLRFWRRAYRRPVHF